MKKQLMIAALMVGVTFFSSMINANAKKITMNDVDTSLKKMIAELYPDVSKQDLVKTEIDTANKTYTIIGADNSKFSVNYTDDYIEFDNKQTEITEENADEALGMLVYISALSQSVLRAGGYGEIKDTKAFSKADYSKGYEKYGFQLETVEFNVKSSDGSSTVSGDFVKYFKMSLDTTKLDKLAEELGVSKSSSTTTEQTTKKEELKNPNTGAFANYTLLIGSALVSLAVIIKVAKKLKFYSI